MAGLLALAPGSLTECIFGCNCLSSPLPSRKQDSDGHGTALPRSFHGCFMDG
jgi:hypothetical protein